MSDVLEPPDDGDDDITDAEIEDEADETDALLAVLEVQLSDIKVDEAEVENVRGLSRLELLTKFQSVQRELRAIGEMHYPHTDKGRELHSRLTAYRVELDRRQMK